MNVHRCYFLDRNRRIIERQDFHAGSDSEAIAAARGFTAERTMLGFELWEGIRRVRNEQRELPR